MSNINTTKLVEACTAKDYQERLNAAIEELKSLDLEVEVKHTMCQAQKGVGYMYSALLIGRK